MEYRTLGRTGWKVSEVGHGLWGMGGWSGSDDEQSIEALDRSVRLGCTFFDTAWAYGSGKSEHLLGDVVRSYPNRGLIVATKVPPKNQIWPSRRGFSLDDCFPPDHIAEYAERSLKNLGLARIDLLQFHVWEDAWARDERWQRAIDELKRQGLIRAFGISLNRWEPANGVEAVKTGLIDAVQVIYNIFDQSPEDELFPACREHKVGVIARVPFDEGSLTGTLTKESAWPEGDWRGTYFVPENLSASVDRAEAVKALVPDEMTLPELALRFILAEPTVSTVIPGMRQPRHVDANIATSDGRPLDPALREALRAHRWDRTPTGWSQ